MARKLNFFPSPPKKKKNQTPVVFRLVEKHVARCSQTPENSSVRKPAWLVYRHICGLRMKLYRTALSMFSLDVRSRPASVFVRSTFPERFGHLGLRFNKYFGIRAERLLLTGRWLKPRTHTVCYNFDLTILWYYLPCSGMRIVHLRFTVNWATTSVGNWNEVF